jgi:hypothetical protein
MRKKKVAILLSSYQQRIRRPVTAVNLITTLPEPVASFPFLGPAHRR